MSHTWNHFTTTQRQFNYYEAAEHGSIVSGLVKFSFCSNVQPEYHHSNCIKMTDGHDLKMTWAFASRSLGTTYVYVLLRASSISVGSSRKMALYPVSEEQCVTVKVCRSLSQLSRWIPAASLSSLIENSEKAWHLEGDSEWQPGRKGGRKQTPYFIPKPPLKETKSLESCLPSPW